MSAPEKETPAPPPSPKKNYSLLATILGVGLSLFTLQEVNYQVLNPLSQLSVFVALGMTLCFLTTPFHPSLAANRWMRGVDTVLAIGSVICCGYLMLNETALLERAGAYKSTDIAIAVVGVALVLEATRRSIGWALPTLSGVFLFYAFVGPHLPDWAFPHRGYDLPRVASQVFLRTEGVFGTAVNVMFRYVYLFVLFGAFLEVSGGTQFIVRFAKKIFGTAGGGAAKVGVLGSGLMGSLSGSAVANAVTTGTFTIPMMRSSGFQPHVAAGITAAAASGGALVPPVMGAGAYMMLEIVEPAVTFVEIVKAATIPAILYYLSIFLIVHFYAKRSGIHGDAEAEAPTKTSENQPLFGLEGWTFFGALGLLIGLLIVGVSPTRAVTGSLGFILLMTILNPKIDVEKKSRVEALVGVPVSIVALKLLLSWLDPENDSWATAGVFSMGLLLLSGLGHPQWRPLILSALVKSAKNGVSLVCASACVGIVIGVVTLTGVGTAFPNAIVPIAENSLFLALIAIMVCSIILGMGLPSAVCYLLMATLIGPALNRLGVPPLAAHLFIFYFGMMSMVTPPVALAAYASASIAGSPIMSSGLAAFRFSLVGFTLPFMFVYRPALLMLPDGESPVTLALILKAVIPAALGIVALAAALAGYLFRPLNPPLRAALGIAAAMALFPDSGMNIVGIPLFDILGAALLAVVAVATPPERAPATP